MMEHSAGVLTDVPVAAADGMSEREEAMKHAMQLRRLFDIADESLAADKGQDAGEFLPALEEEGVCPAAAGRERKIHVNDEKPSARARMLIEPIAGVAENLLLRGSFRMA